jgi:hypothetical protein
MTAMGTPLCIKTSGLMVLIVLLTNYSLALFPKACVSTIFAESEDVSILDMSNRLPCEKISCEVLLREPPLMRE